MTEFHVERDAWSAGPVRVSRDVALWTRQTDGPADRVLLVVHGGPDWDGSYLTEPLDRLAPGHRVVLPDLRGCGRSTAGLADDEYSPDAVVADLLALLDALDVARADLLGFSWGGLVAQRLAAAAPGRVRRLVLASTSVLPVPADAFAGWAERDRRREREAAVWADLPMTGPEWTRAAAEAGAEANVWRAEALPAYRERLARVRFSAEWMRPWRAGTLASPRLPDPVARLAATGLPVLLLHGRQDMVFPAALVEPTGAQLPGARAVLLDDAGHMAHVDTPDAWLAAVRGFLG